MDLTDLLKKDREDELKDQLNTARQSYSNLTIKDQNVQSLFVDVISKIVKNEFIEMIVMEQPAQQVRKELSWEAMQRLS